MKPSRAISRVRMELISDVLETASAFITEITDHVAREGFTELQLVCETSGSHSDEYKDDCLLGCNNV
jgi:hypothetical protein